MPDNSEILHRSLMNSENNESTNGKLDPMVLFGNAHNRKSADCRYLFIYSFRFLCLISNNQITQKKRMETRDTRLCWNIPRLRKRFQQRH
jgi:hypothetical protein